MSELEDLRAEVERLTGSLEIALGRLTDSGHPEDLVRFARLHLEAALEGTSRPLILAERRAEAAEAKVAAVEALADEWANGGIPCDCGHTLDTHNGLGCYERLSYEPLVTCACKLTDNRTESAMAADILRAALASVGRTEPGAVDLTFNLPLWRAERDHRTSDLELRTPNAGTAFVRVTIDPTLKQPGNVRLTNWGEEGPAYEVTLRAMDQQVLLHELLHVVIDPVIPAGVTFPLPAPGGEHLCPLNHQVIGAIEVAFAGLLPNPTADDGAFAALRHSDDGLACRDCGADWHPVRRGECIRCGSDSGPAPVVTPSAETEGDAS